MLKPTFTSSIHSGKRFVLTFIAAQLLAACSTSAVKPTSSTDPWEGWNRDVNEFNNDFDDTILKPVAKGYQNTVPNPIDESITNVFSNINDIGVTINDFLQLKFAQGGMDASRFLINTTVGLVGVFDVAKEIDLPKHNEDFGQTLGYWGIPSGNYMVLPFIGASSPRDAVGLLGDALFNPLTYVSFFGGFAANAATAAATGVDITDTRSDLMASEKILNEASVDRYDFVKNSYIQRRDYLIYDGNPPEEDNDPLFEENSNASNSDVSNTGAVSSAPLYDDAKPHDPNGVQIINNSGAMPSEEPATSLAPVIDNSHHMLDLTAPDDQ
jgi:phospholipid-binding lipoprotein MlaA